MTPQQIVALAVRLFSIWLALQSLNIISLGNAINMQPGLGETNSHYFMAGFVLFVALLLWLFPLFVAHALIPRTRFDDELRLPLQETVVVACITIGLWVLISQVLPSLAYYLTLIVATLHTREKLSGNEAFEFMRLAPIAIQFAVALILMLKARAISGFLQRHNSSENQ